MANIIYTQCSAHLKLTTDNLSIHSYKKWKLYRRRFLRWVFISEFYSYSIDVEELKKIGYDIFRRADVC